MATVKGIDHLVIRVGDFRRSKAFYDKVLGFLGFELAEEFPGMAGWANGKTLFWIGQADAKGKRRPHRIGDIGFHHYAFKLGRRKDVDDLYGLLTEIGAKVVDPPADYPDYGDGYYAVFFLDPDGLKLEGMVFDPKAAQRAREKERKPSRKGGRKR
jgi:catechol 2,3-dioxygenase-like lactoylglutathione lyase family enzyme